MKVLSEQKSKALDEKHGWSLDFAEGFLKGEYSRRCGARLSAYGTVGLDDYCLGFRAGYFKRQAPPASREKTAGTEQRNTSNPRLGAVAASTPTTTFKQRLAY